MIADRIEIIQVPFIALGVVLFVVTTIVSGMLLLRVIAAWVGANPFGRLSYNLTRWTEPLVRPLRAQFIGRHQRYDLMPLVVGILILASGLFITSVVFQIGDVLADITQTARDGNITGRFLAREAINLAALLYVGAILSRFFLPVFGIGYSNKFMRFVYAITEPLLKPLRRFFVSNMFDFSPLVLILAVEVLKRILMDSLS
ncbi:MAG TPA: YggT family protein [Blastocatellia bacterium]|nr:YggT family protein [Blastocatellia bacterium]